VAIWHFDGKGVNPEIAGLVILEKGTVKMVMSIE